MEINEKVAIITGASSGIGKALTIELAKNKAKVVLAARNLDALLATKKEIDDFNGIAHIVVTDVSKEDQCKNLIQQTIEHFGKIDILVNNAGISMRANFTDLHLDVIRKVMDVNFYGTVYCTKYALPYLIKSQGYVIGISSISGITPLPGRTGYCASKYALAGFLNTLRLETIKDGLKVMIVYPGFTSSEIRKKALNKDGEPQGESPRNEGKMMSAEKLAEIIVNGIKKNKRKIVTTLQGKLAIWLYSRFPSFIDKLIIKTMKKEPNSPDF